MAIKLADDFKEFLKLLNAHEVRYLLIGGYAVAWHGYPRATDDLDVWIAIAPDNAEKVVAALREFGFDVAGLSAALFLKEKQIIRMGHPPLRIEISTAISGVAFEECHAARIDGILDEVHVPLISLEHLKANKAASGRKKDLADLDNLP